MRSKGVHDGRKVLSIWKGNLSKTEKDFTRFQLAKPIKRRSERNNCLRWAYPCSEKVKHVRISSTSGSTMYTSIKNWKYTMDHLIMIKQVRIWISHIRRWSMKLKDEADHWFQKLIPIVQNEHDGIRWYYIATRMPAYRMSLWRTATYNMEWCQLAAIGATGKWTKECWCISRSSPTTVVHFYTMGINDLKSTMWGIIWLLVINVYRQQTRDYSLIMIMRVKVPSKI